MNTVVVGIGECGRNIALHLYYQLNSMRYRILMKSFDFFITDSEDILRMKKDIERKGIPEEVINPGKIDERIKPLNVFMLTPTSGRGGYGGNWILSSKIAQEIFYDGGIVDEKYISSINDSARFAECLNIFNSAGGGTGNGAGPVFLEYMRKKSAKETLRTLYTATVVLPFKNEDDWRNVNAAVNIARYSKLCDGILIADNEHLKSSMKQDNKTAQKGVDDLLSSVWMWMNACSSMHLSVSPKRWEGADFKRSFKIGNFGAPVVPCYREEPVETLKRINIGWIVLRAIRENCAAACLPNTSKRILVIISKSDNVGCTFSESQIEDYLSKELQIGEKSEINVIFIKGRAAMSASVAVLLIAPKIPMLERLEKKFRSYLENPTLFERDLLVADLPREEVWEAYKNEYENFKKYIEYLKMFD